VGPARAVQRGERAVNWLWILAALFVVLGSLMAMAEASLTRMTRIRALSLEEEGRRNAALLVRLETDPPRYLNSIYLTVMIVQNGSAILVAILAESTFGGLGVTIASLIFTLLYFVLVEAMAKTFAILHSDRVALALSPLVFFLGRVLAWPTRALIGLANVLLPGKGLKAGPFVSEGDIRSMAEVGSEEGSIEEEEKELIHSIFEFGDTIVREVMVPRPDIICIEDDKTLRDVQALVLTHGTSRIPVYNAKEDLDDVIGIIFAKDVLKALHQGKQDLPLPELVRPARYVPESKKVGVLLREMQQEKFHMALVTDEYGSVTGLVALEDLLEELVGEITDEYDREETEIQEVEPGVYRVSGKTSVDDVNEELEAELPDEEWDTIAGLVLDLFGRIPDEGEEVTLEGLRFRAEEVIGRRIARVLITRVPADGEDPLPVEVAETEA
jgi:CBS domain containing-hemolysin-like protein